MTIVQHRSGRQTELITDAISYLGPAYLYDLPLLSLRLLLFYSFDEPFVTQVALVRGMVLVIAMPIL